MRASRVLAVASSLPDMSPSELATVLTERGLTPTATAHPLHLATQLLEPAAAINQLSHLSADELERLRQASAGDSEVLIAADSTRLLAEKSDSHLQLAPEMEEAISAQGSNGSSDISQDHTVDVVAVLAVIEKMETLVRSVELQPVNGTTSEALMSWAMSQGDDQATWETAAEICRGVGLLAVHHDGWHQTTGGSEWLLAALSERWAWLLSRLWSIRPRWVDSPPANHGLPAMSSGGWVTMAAKVGVFPGSGKGSAADVLARGGDITTWVSGQLPEPADQVYLDGPDTLVTAGPLPVPHERALRRIGQWLSGNVASRFRVTAQTVLRAKQRGLSTAEITDAIELVVPGGTTSALGVTLVDSVRRAEQLTIQWSESGTVVDCADPLVLDLLCADRKLQLLGFEKTSESRLASAQSVNTVHELLTSEGYPHLVVDQSGDVFDVDKSPQASVTWVTTTGGDMADALLDYWKSWRRDSPADWWEPILEWAIAHKLRLSAIVNLNDAESEFVIEPKSLRNRRLRARDTRSDVERTIPVTHLVRIHSPEAVSTES